MKDKRIVFEKLTFNHKKYIEDFIKKFPPYSDFSFTSIWTYNTDNLVEIGKLNTNLVVKFQDYKDKKPFYSFIGEVKIEETAGLLLNHAKVNGIQSILKLVPEVVISKSKNLADNFLIKEDPDNHDYVVSAYDLAFLRHQKYKKKRYLVGRFRKKFPEHKVIKLDLSNKQVKNEMLDLFFRWEIINKRGKEAENERKAFKRMLDFAEKLNIYGTGIYINYKLAAFTTYELVHNKYGMALFEKADKTFTDIYTAITHEGASHLHKLGCTYINFEQDLGLEGLKKAKSLWKPTHHLKKYTIEFKK